MKPIRYLCVMALIVTAFALAVLAQEEPRSCNPNKSVVARTFTMLPLKDKLPAWKEQIIKARDSGWKAWKPEQKQAFNDTVKFLNWYIKLVERDGEKAFDFKNPAHKNRLDLLVEKVKLNFNRDELMLFTRITDETAFKYVPIAEREVVQNIMYRPAVFQDTKGATGLLAKLKKFDESSCHCASYWTDGGLGDCPNDGCTHECTLKTYPYDSCIEVINCGFFQAFACSAFCWHMGPCYP